METSPCPLEEGEFRTQAGIIGVKREIIGHK